ncbi:MAG TPA: NYN domain-containing protein [Actinomycetota bacterium]
MATDEERIALFIDHENLVLGAREIGRAFDVGPIMEALAERGRVVARRAYADWTLFADDRRTLVEHNCELIDIPQRTGAVRKNAADIKLAVDAMELAYERGFVSTFVIASGDSDFTPLVAALRALNRRVIGIGVKGSTSALLPPSCDEFLFYDRLPGVGDIAPQRAGRGGNGKPRPAQRAQADREAPKQRNGNRDLHDVQRMLTQTLAGLKQSGTESVLASTLKRAVLRKDPTFSESDYGFRAFGELLRQLERNGVISLAGGQAPGDPAVDFPDTGQSSQAFETLRTTVLDLQGDDDEVPLSGLKDQIRKRVPNWSEKDLGYAGFLQFAKAAAASGAVNMEFDDDEGDYFLYVPDD